MNTMHSCFYVFNVCTKIYAYNVPYIWYGFNTCIQKTTVISVPCLSWRFFVGQILPWLLPHNSESSLPQDDVAFLNKIHKHSRKSWTRWGCDFTKFPSESRCNSGTSCWMEALQAQTELNSGGKAVRSPQSVRKVSGLLGTAASNPSLLGRCICVFHLFHSNWNLPLRSHSSPPHCRKHLLDYLIHPGSIGCLWHCILCTLAKRQG